jgi:hypothetical protein
VAEADEVPARAVKTYVVLQAGLTWRDPLGGTVPIPSIWTLSAPSTSQLNVAVLPAAISAGEAVKRWMASPPG